MAYGGVITNAARFLERRDPLAQAHALIVDDAVLVWVVHDTNPHALSPRIKKFVQAQHWFQDLTTIGVE